MSMNKDRSEAQEPRPPATIGPGGAESLRGLARSVVAAALGADVTACESIALSAGEPGWPLFCKVLETLYAESEASRWLAGHQRHADIAAGLASELSEQMEYIASDPDRLAAADRELERAVALAWEHRPWWPNTKRPANMPGAHNEPTVDALHHAEATVWSAAYSAAMSTALNTTAPGSGPHQAGDAAVIAWRESLRTTLSPVTGG